jgi:hypothetical protein
MSLRPHLSTAVRLTLASSLSLSPDLRNPSHCHRVTLTVSLELQLGDSLTFTFLRACVHSDASNWRVLLRLRVALLAV